MALACANCTRLLPGTLNLYVAETYRLRERIDIRLRAGHKVPAIRCLGMPVALHVLALLGRGQAGVFTVGSMLTTIMLKSFPGTNLTICSALASPSISSEQSIGHR